MRFLAAIAVLLTLGACGAEEVGSPPAAISSASYVHPGPATLTLVTVINNTTDNGAHTGLIINGSQRVVWDPAGTYNTTRVMPERGDVLYGFTPAFEQSYIDYHTRPAYRTITQTVRVTPEVAEQVLRLAVANGPAAKASCALSTSAILSQVPGFESVGSTWFPNQLMERFGQVGGVETKIYRDEDGAVALAAL